MSADTSYRLKLRPWQAAGARPGSAGKRMAPSGETLAAAITRAASKQTYFTVRLLVDRERVDDAFRAYAYFRWVDDVLDRDESTQEKRLAFLAHQQRLVARCYRRQWLGALAPEERLLPELIRSNETDNDGLRAYVENMMAVMAFDAERRGRIISQAELDAYTHWLAVSVTEALHFFIGHNSYSPQGEARYLAATAAHITHMLRDTMEDLDAGYYNVPHELLAAEGITPADVQSDPYRQWVAQRVQLARDTFAAGKQYLALVENARCRLAGCAYIARFEGVLDAIEQDGYRLRNGYPECKGVSAILRGARLALRLTLPRRSLAAAPHPAPGILLNRNAP